MAVNQRVNAKTLGKCYAEIVRERDLPVQGIWVRDTAEGPTLWILIESIELKDELPIHQALVDVHREFPDALFEDRVINPSWLPNFVEENEIPRDATRVKLRT